MESYSLIKYKFDTGIYSLKQMSKMVENEELSEEQFFDITRCNYNGLKQNDKISDVTIVETNENL